MNQTNMSSTLNKLQFNLLNMNINQRIQARMIELGLRQKDLVTATGASRGTVSLWVNGPSEPEGEYLLKLAKKLNLSPEWILTGKESYEVKEKESIYQLVNTSIVPAEQLEKRPDVPLLSWVSAGAWLQNHGSFSKEDAIRWLPCPVAHSPMTFALKVDGDSMTSPYPNEKSYPHGTLIYVDPERPVTNRCSVVAYLPAENAYTFKKYVEDAGRRYLKPLNPAYSMIPITDDIKICGVVIGAFFDE